MAGRRSPSVRWNKEHRSKRVHRWRWQAWLHAWNINNFHDDGKRHRSPYPCHWGSDYHDGENFPKHWHVGRSSNHHSKGYEGHWPGYSAEEMERLMTGEERRNLNKPNT